jgi:hypothetical protein
MGFFARHEHLSEDERFKNLLLRAINKFRELRNFVRETDSELSKRYLHQIVDVFGIYRKLCEGKRDPRRRSEEVTSKIAEIRSRPRIM